MISKSSKFGLGSSAFTDPTKKKLSVVNEIYLMMSHGYVRNVSDARMNLLQIDNMDIAYIDQPEYIPSELMRHIYKKFWVPFVADVYKHRTAIGVCPFIMREEVVEFNGEKRSSKIPVALPEHSFDISSYIDTETGRIQYSVNYHNLRELKNDEDIYVIGSLYRRGPSPVNNLFVDSDAGSLVHDWMA
jgi:hypothetical protein